MEALLFSRKAQCFVDSNEIAILMEVKGKTNQTKGKT